MHEIAEHVMIQERMWTTLLIHTFDTHELQFPVLNPMMLSRFGIACSYMQAHPQASPHGFVTHIISPAQD